MPLPVGTSPSTSDPAAPLRAHLLAGLAAGVHAAQPTQIVEVEVPLKVHLAGAVRAAFVPAVSFLIIVVAPSYGEGHHKEEQGCGGHGDVLYGGEAKDHGNKPSLLPMIELVYTSLPQLVNPRLMRRKLPWTADGGTFYTPLVLRLGSS